MKPFNLEEAIQGKPLVTRDGRKVLDFHYFKKSKSEYPISAVIDGDNEVETYTISGELVDGEENEIDLFMYEEPTEKEYMIAIYEKDNKGNFTLVNSLESPFKQGQIIEITIP